MDKYMFYLGMDKSSKQEILEFMESEKFPLNNLTMSVNNGLYKGEPEKSMEIIYIDIENNYNDKEISEISKILENKFDQNSVLVEKQKTEII